MPTDAPVRPPVTPAALSALVPRLSLPRAYNAAVDFLDRHLAEGRGARVAVIDDDGSLTYEELAARASQAGDALRRLGLAPEQRVALLLLDSARFPAFFFGAMKLGAVPVPFNTLLVEPDYDHMLRDSRARVLVVSEALFPRVAGVLEAQPWLEHVLVDGALPEGFVAGATGPRVAPLAPLLERASARLEAAATTCDDVAFWLYTSGSTGQPKAAVHLHGHLAHTAFLYGEGVLGIREDDLVFSAAKLFFAYGLGNSLTFPFRVGAAVLLMAERPTTAAVIRRLRDHRPTVFCGVPTLYAALLADPALPPGDSLRLRRCTSAGEALPASVGRRWEGHVGCEILDGLGSTEMLHIFLSNRPGEVRHGTTGTVVPGYEAKLVDDHGDPVAPGEAGYLLVSGPSAASCYWNRRELSLRTFEGRWTRTGDRYLQAADGSFVYQGRSDDMLKVGGIYVSPFEVEAALASHPAVLEAAVVAHADENDLVKPKAFVVLKAGATPSDALADELKAHVKRALAPYKYPRWVAFVDDLPKTATGKIQRFKLRAPQGPAAPPPRAA